MVVYIQCSVYNNTSSMQVISVIYYLVRKHWKCCELPVWIEWMSCCMSTRHVTIYHVMINHDFKFLIIWIDELKEWSAIVIRLCNFLGFPSCCSCSNAIALFSQQRERYYTVDRMHMTSLLAEVTAWMLQKKQKKNNGKELLCDWLYK